MVGWAFDLLVQLAFCLLCLTVRHHVIKADVGDVIANALVSELRVGVDVVDVQQVVSAVEEVLHDREEVIRRDV